MTATKATGKATHSGICQACGIRYTINVMSDVVRGHPRPDGSPGRCPGGGRQPRRGTKRPVAGPPPGTNRRRRPVPHGTPGDRRPGRRPDPVDDAETAAREFTCGWCGATPTRQCRDRRGIALKFSHADRRRQALAAGRLPGDAT